MTESDMGVATCSKCGQLKKITEFYKNRSGGNKHRSRCKKCTNEDNKKYRLAQNPKVRKYWREYARKYRLAHPEKKHKRNSITDRLNKQKVKYRVFSNYCGGEPQCQICGFKNIVALTIDHINGNGNLHRRELYGRNRGGGGYSFYVWLRRNNYPKEFRVLCMNCQWIEKERLKNERTTQCVIG